MTARVTPGRNGLQARALAASVALLLAQIVLLMGCAGEPHAGRAEDAARGRELIASSLPQNLPDRAGWTADIEAGFRVLSIEPTRETVCAVRAVIEQESGFREDPVVPNLPRIAWQAIDDRAANAGVPRLVVHTVLGLTSSNGRSYRDRIDHATTEKELSDIFEDFIGAVPLGRTLFADHNPIRTRGPMQVNIAFAEQFAERRPYPYPVKVSIADEVFTRRGGLYFGIAHLLDYAAPYDSFLFRFADFNAGQYASRNAAFQRALGSASGVALVADGALLPHGDTAETGATERAARSLARRLGMSNEAIHEALARGKTPEFEHTSLYQRVFSLAEQARGRALPRAAVPSIELHSPKITRKLTTDWYAHRVDERFHRCLK